MTFPVLVCDDSLVARKQVVRCFKEFEDITCVQATNGLEALDLLRKQEFGLLCLDLTMPQCDGLGVLNAMKEERIECMTVVISADIQAEMKRRVAALGAIDFIEKPVSAAVLHPLLKRFGVI